MKKFIKVFNINREIVILNVRHIVLIEKYQDCLIERARITDSLGHIYLSLSDMEEFKSILGIED